MLHGRHSMGRPRELKRLARSEIILLSLIVARSARADRLSFVSPACLTFPCQITAKRNVHMYHPAVSPYLRNPLDDIRRTQCVVFAWRYAPSTPPLITARHGNYKINFYHGICRINKTFPAFTTGSLNELANFSSGQASVRVKANCLKYFGIFGHVLDTNPRMFVRSYRIPNAQIWTSKFNQFEYWYAMTHTDNSKRVTRSQFSRAV